jgi:hypothetical protein
MEPNAPSLVLLRDEDRQLAHQAPIVAISNSIHEGHQTPSGDNEERQTTISGRQQTLLHERSWPAPGIELRQVIFPERLQRHLVAAIRAVKGQEFA